MKLRFFYSCFFLLFSINCCITVREIVACMVVDRLGRVIEVVEYPLRVVSLAPSITEMIFALKAQEKLIGVTTHSDYPREAKLLPIIGNFIHPDLEKITILDPDLCFALKGSTPLNTITCLEKLKIPVYVIDSENIYSIINSLKDIACLLNVEDIAIHIIKNLKNHIDNIKFTVSKSDIIPRVFIQIGTSPIISAGERTFIDDLIAMSGCINVARNLGLYPQLSYEEVLMLAPDVIIITSMLNDDALMSVKSQWEDWISFYDESIVEVFVEKSDFLNRPSLRLVDGLELLVHRIHHKSFERIN